jgi:hypothetical protein
MEKWKDLDVKNKIAFVTACFAFAIGWGLTIAGFIVPPLGAVSDSILWILGQALVYAASVLGIGMYVGGEMKRMKGEIGRFMKHPEETEEIIEEMEE